MRNRSVILVSLAVAFVVLFAALISAIFARQMMRSEAPTITKDVASGDLDGVRQISERSQRVASTARAAAAAARRVAVAARQVAAEANMGMAAGSAYGEPCPDYEDAYRDQCFGASYYHGDFIQGNWENDKLNGPGVYQWKSAGRSGQVSFEGTYRNHNFSGPGVLYYRNGDRYEGNFQSDRENGQGVKFYADGGRYEGYFRNGREVSPGIFFRADGTTDIW